MLDWAITKIKLAINQFWFDEENLKDGVLDAFDWRTLGSIRDFLQIFHDG